MPCRQKFTTILGGWATILGGWATKIFLGGKQVWCRSVCSPEISILRASHGDTLRDT